MNLNLGKFYIFFCCIVPIILPASSPKLENNTGFYPIQASSPSHPNSRIISSQSQQFRSLNDVTSEQFNAMFLQHSSQSHVKQDIQSANSSPRSQKSGKSRLNETELKEIFKGYTPGKNRAGDNFSDTSSISAEVMKTSFNKNGQILTIPELIRNSAASRLKKLNNKEIAQNIRISAASRLNEERNKEIAESIKSHEVNIQMMQKGRKFLTACALATPLVVSSLLTKSEPQSRFGIVAATSVLSILPTIAGCLGTLFVFYKIDKALHCGADILRADVKKWRIEDKEKFTKQFQAYGKMLDKEIVDRIQGDKDIRKENLTTLDKEVSDLKVKFTQLSHNLEKAQIDVAHARDEISIIGPQVHRASQNTQDLKGFIATQIFPAVEKIQHQVTAMRMYNEQPAINPLADSIEFNNELNQVYISSDSEQEHKSHTPPAKMVKRNALRLNNPKNQDLPISAEDYFGAHAESFMNQFKTKKPASSSTKVSQSSHGTSDAAKTTTDTSAVAAANKAQKIDKNSK